MPRDQVQELLHRIGVMEKTIANLSRQGTVHEVYKDKMRINYGNGPDGQPVLSPWIHSHNMRGGNRERQYWKKGQNVTMFSPSGDPRLAMVLPFAPNQDNKAPDHADDSGSQAHTYQLDSLRVAQVDGGYEVWLADQSSSQGSSSSGSGSTSGSSSSSSSSQPKMNLRIDKDGGITARIGTDVRMAVHADGAKIKHKSGGSIFVDKDGCWSSKPIQQKDDPIPDDDNNGFKTQSWDDQSSGSGSSGSTNGVS